MEVTLLWIQATALFEHVNHVTGRVMLLFLNASLAKPLLISSK
tara:strand:- start:3681 stop:3809 length:129 start_codon:yes stop_codon:yes gene_type:complete